MEIFAIVVLGLSVFVGFSTSARKPKIQSDRRREEDPDWAFTEAYDSDESREKVWGDRERLIDTPVAAWSCPNRDSHEWYAHNLHARKSLYCSTELLNSWTYIFRLGDRAAHIRKAERKLRSSGCGSSSGNELGIIWHQMLQPNQPVLFHNLWLYLC